MGRGVKIFLVVVIVLDAFAAGAVQPVFDPAGTSFYDMPFPHELRRDADGTVSLANFPLGTNPLVAVYIHSLEATPGFGLNSGVFVKFDGDLDTSTLPSSPDASRQPGASVFLIDIDPQSDLRGERVPLWIDFRSSSDAYRDAGLLAAMPVPGHPLEPNTLYALVITDALHGDDAASVSTAALIQHMKDETPQGAFEQAALPLYQSLWAQLEGSENLPRSAVVTATVFRTYDPVAGMVATEKLIRKQYEQAGSDIAYAGDHPSFWLFTGNLVDPQFQTGTPPFVDTSTGAFAFDAGGTPIVQREETLQFVLAIPKETTDGTIKMPRGGWPVVAYMHGTGGNRFSFVNEGVAGVLATVGVASISIDQPLHGLRLGATADGQNFYNPLYPLALRDNPRQAAADSVTVHQLLRRLRVDPHLITDPPGAGFEAPARRIKFKRSRRLFMGHSQGATTGPLFLAVAKDVRGGVISAGGGHIIVNILTREAEFFAGLKLRDLVEAVLGAPIDVFHPALHLLQMGSDVSDPVAFAPYFATKRSGPALSLLFTHGMLDPQVTTPMTAAMVAAARYPLVAPTFPPIVFPKLPGYSYQETFDLAGLPTLTPPVSGNLDSRKRSRGTGGIIFFEHDGHFPVFQNPTAMAQYQEFVRSLAYDPPPTIPAP